MCSPRCNIQRTNLGSNKNQENKIIAMQNTMEHLILKLKREDKIKTVRGHCQNHKKEIKETASERKPHSSALVAPYKHLKKRPMNNFNVSIQSSI